MTTTIRDRLRASTREAHERLEATLRLDGSIDRERYGLWLRATHAFYRAAEPAVEAARVVPDPVARRKVPWLEADLHHLGLEPMQESPPWHAPASPAAALGCAYVMEGATLGARSLFPALSGRLDVDAEGGGRFISGYGEASGSRWRQFLAALESARLDDGPSRECVAAAIAFFEDLGAWLLRSGACAVKRGLEIQPDQGRCPGRDGREHFPRR